MPLPSKMRMADLLRWFAEQDPRQLFSTRQVSYLAQAEVSSTLGALRSLEDAGIATSRDDGGRRRWALLGTLDWSGDQLTSQKSEIGSLPAMDAPSKGATSGSEGHEDRPERRIGGAAA